MAVTAKGCGVRGNLRVLAGPVLVGLTVLVLVILVYNYYIPQVTHIGPP